MVPSAQMRRMPSNSVRTVAFAVAFCALGIAAGCGNDTFNLLPNAPLVIAGRAATNAGSDSGGAGTGGSLGGGGKGGSGAAGKANIGGFGGHFPPFPMGGSAGSLPCLGEAGCADAELPCMAPYCVTCTDNSNCEFLDGGTCDPELKRCVQCRSDTCGVGERCNPHTFRCDKACVPAKDNCAADGQHQTCSAELGVCVYCDNKPGDCDGYGQFKGRCYLNVCVECFENTHCGNQEICVYGRCVMH